MYNIEDTDTYEKRPTHIQRDLAYRKRPVLWGETTKYLKRDLCIRQKTRIHMKRDLHI